MLTLVFENCEMGVSQKESILYLNICEITESIYFSSAQAKTETLKTCKAFNVGIKNPSPELVERCLKYDDITQIHWEDATYFIDWGDQDYKNENQSSYVAEDGVLHISVEEFDGSLFQC